MKNISFLICAILLCGIVTSKAQYVVLYNFSKSTGANPEGSLILEGKILYGMTHSGGTYNYGTVFSVDTNGNGYKVLHNFDSVAGTGYGPVYTKLILSGNILYGMTALGGLNNDGCIFSIDTSGNNYKDMFDFNGSNGDSPSGSLLFIGNKLYGMTELGGIHNDGCIFSIDTNGNNYVKLHDFNGTDGSLPFGSLIVSGKTLFGMTSGIVVGLGNVFSIDTNGSAYRVLLNFNGTNGQNPYGSLTLLRNKLYGMTYSDGEYFQGLVFSIDSGGGEYNQIAQFDGGSPGAEPYGSLVLSGNRLYGMNWASYGAIFYVDTNGTYPIIMHTFIPVSGTNPYGDLTLSGSTLFGMTSIGGANNVGVVFKISTNTNVTSIDKIIQNASEIKLFPNPNDGKFTIQLPVVSGQRSEVEIYNMLGEQIYSTPLKIKNSEFNINLGSQPSGIYLYRIITEQREQVSTGKFVIE